MEDAVGTEWLVDARGCAPEPLRSRDVLSGLFDALVSDLGLHPVGEAVWHVFPDPGGVTGLMLLRESHVACHTFPEIGHAAFNLYCCRPRPEWPWAQRLGQTLRAAEVAVRRVERGRP